MTDRSGLWSGRRDGDGPEHDRWHTVIRPLAESAEPGVAIIGFASDEGVRRNHGRTGAQRGPASLRGALAGLAAHDLPALYEAGDVTVEGTDLEGGHSALATRIAEVVRAGHLPVVLGGGHEVAFGSYLGLTAVRTDPTRRLGVVNIDAHFDLRAAQRATSGTGFLQMLQAEKQAGRELAYTVLGIAQTSNTRALFDTADKWGVTYRTDLECTEAHASGIRNHLESFLADVDDVYLTLDLDALPGWIAPGVSAPAALGVQVETVLTIVETIAQSGKLALFDVAELNPDLDLDGRTARVAARIINHLVTRTEAT
ncbi:formimidoylglutamase [Microbacterium sp. MPKO10]|uniref:formimidoylglutamase n=1 Tax=Microbacterium sp. MPKO10 TaxID=2989818 RepID=UPI0022358F96|nr:formimidoylglutamase [Microbacterium sp. MPKO10]MCW4459945.1 formimidoylglutamase [Microbacterium sp. MPKO10]